MKRAPGANMKEALASAKTCLLAANLFIPDHYPSDSLGRDINRVIAMIEECITPLPHRRKRRQGSRESGQ